MRLIPIVVNALGTVVKGLKKKRLEKLELRGRIETIQIIKTGKNTQKSHGNQKQLVAT